jgi:hypothetical protein
MVSFYLLTVILNKIIQFPEQFFLVGGIFLFHQLAKGTPVRLTTYHADNPVLHKPPYSFRVFFNQLFDPGIQGYCDFSLVSDNVLFYHWPSHAAYSKSMIYVSRPIADVGIASFGLYTAKLHSIDQVPGNAPGMYVKAAQ